ncbi:MAG: PH domain-containing protein [Nitriliruptoraceae bacterium]
MPSDDAPPIPADQFSEARSLHPSSVVLGIPTAQLVQALFVPAAAVIATGGLLSVGIIGVVMVVGLVGRTLAWLRFRFSFDGEVVRISSGVLSRNYRTVAIGRIQQVEIDRPALQRLFGVASIRIETAGSASEPEVELRVLRDVDAVAFRNAVRASKAQRGASLADDSPAGAQPILRVSNPLVALAAVTGVQLLILPAVLAGALQFVGPQLQALLDRAVRWLVTNGTSLDELVRRPNLVLIGLTVAGISVASIVVAVVTGLLRDGNFCMERSGDEFVVTRGILGTRDSIIPRKRIQLVEIQANPVQRLLGYRVVRISSAGGSTGADRRVTIPMVHTSRVPQLINTLFDQHVGVHEMQRHPPAARRRAFWRWLRRGAVIAGAFLAAATTLGDAGWPTTGIVATAVVGVAAILAEADYRLLGHAVGPHAVAARRGPLGVTVQVCPIRRMQALSTRANWFQRRLGLASLIAHTAGPSPDLLVLDGRSAELDALRDELVRASHNHLPTT